MTHKSPTHAVPAVERALARASVTALFLCCFATSCSADGHPEEAEGEDAGPSPLDSAERYPGGDTTNTFLFGVNAFSRLVQNATPENEALFFSGNSFFTSAWVEAPASTEARDGLGPLFNARSCAACHAKDGRGRPPTDDESVTGLLVRLGSGKRTKDGFAEPHPTYGDQLQNLSLPSVPAEGQLRIEHEVVDGEYVDGEPYQLEAPRYSITAWGYGDGEGVHISPRVAPAMIGLGLLEAIPEARLHELADPEDADGDGISGKLNRVFDVRSEQWVAGRFGWKAEQPSVEQQVAGAFLGDMGITSPLFPEQNCSASQTACLSSATGGEPEIPEDLLLRVVTYSSLLAVPAREQWRSETILAGKTQFTELGCASCHVPRHETGRAHLPELSHQEIWPYTDLLLHDMGEELSDERPHFDAEGSEWRTPPLWGIGRFQEVNGHERLLHDGRARGVAEAVLWHGGEAAASRDRFRELDAENREALVHFVESL